MKTAIKNIASGTFMALLLMVGNVNATETKAESLKAIETSVQLENWMTDDSLWNPISINVIENVQEREADQELENWMINDNSWNINNSILAEAEKVLEIEGWMLNDASWNTDNNTIEPKLTIENWMMDGNIWE